MLPAKHACFYTQNMYSFDGSLSEKNMLSLADPYHHHNAYLQVI